MRIKYIKWILNPLKVTFSIGGTLILSRTEGISRYEVCNWVIKEVTIKTDYDKLPMAHVSDSYINQISG